ncbi:hypothetical protein SAMN05216251_123114 [Actinacidiphila alni]|uniref:Uncharacterized protein n=1 Tax=Actinacidiphila alni TaxID=380248 RepID=A0A1I2KN63_9ACTN|nr:hypothetical protein SAMN05216251_123114 [Actinacidiphila alni]
MSRFPLPTRPYRESDARAGDRRQDAVATGRAGHNGVLFTMCLSLILVVPPPPRSTSRCPTSPSIRARPEMPRPLRNPVKPK